MDRCVRCDVRLVTNERPHHTRSRAMPRFEGLLLNPLALAPDALNPPCPFLPPGARPSCPPQRHTLTGAPRFILPIIKLMDTARLALRAREERILFDTERRKFVNRQKRQLALSERQARRGVCVMPRHATPCHAAPCHTAPPRTQFSPPPHALSSVAGEHRVRAGRDSWLTQSASQVLEGVTWRVESEGGRYYLEGAIRCPIWLHIALFPPSLHPTHTPS